ncbi:hypothetical protein HDU84_002100 [Entophlyctis sp. JEL0112]|nr:hypothetical protein HDU84_002100 [Entophlyctis sp. JEL0112]
MSNEAQSLHEALGAPRHIVGPMVDHSEYAWRILSRRYGAHLCYTPMFHARLFAESDIYRRDQFVSGPDDRPLIVQFCANDPDTLLRAARFVEDSCDAIDLNLGCPQAIAKRGHYGAFLMDDWDLICDMVSILHKNLKIPVTCKIRVFPDVQKTIAYAKRIQDAGCSLLTVHGRTRDMKGHKTGVADWDQIRRVKEALHIPVFANGNINYFEDIQRCLDFTGCDGVMSAEGNLYNPALFVREFPPVWRMAEEYLQICTDIPKSANVGMIRAHLFKIFAPCLNDHPDLRTKLADKHSLEDFWEITRDLKGRLLVRSFFLRLLQALTAKRHSESKWWHNRIYAITRTRTGFTRFQSLAELESAAADALTEDFRLSNSMESKLVEPSVKSAEIVEARLKRKEAKRQAKLGKLEFMSSEVSGEGADSDRLEQAIVVKKARKATGKNPICAAALCLNFGSAKCASGSCKSCCRKQVSGSIPDCKVTVDMGGKSDADFQQLNIYCKDFPFKKKAN